MGKWGKGLMRGDKDLPDKKNGAILRGRTTGGERGRSAIKDRKNERQECEEGLLRKKEKGGTRHYRKGNDVKESE